jgi:hypothetical protein
VPFPNDLIRKFAARAQTCPANFTVSLPNHRTVAGSAIEVLVCVPTNPHPGPILVETGSSVALAGCGCSFVSKSDPIARHDRRIILEASHLVMDPSAQPLPVCTLDPQRYQTSRSYYSFQVLLLKYIPGFRYHSIYSRPNQTFQCIYLNRCFHNH